MSDQNLPDIIYTKTDEAPQLASASLLPILRKFLSEADISIGTKDISILKPISDRRVGLNSR